LLREKRGCEDLLLEQGAREVLLYDKGGCEDLLLEQGAREGLLRDRSEERRVGKECQ
jgi:hypothetical protein